MWYHASPKGNLASLGLDPEAKPLISRKVQQAVYFGSLLYINEQYALYAPKGIYYLYKVNLSGLMIDTDLAGEQCRVFTFVEPQRVTLQSKMHFNGNRPKVLLLEG